MTARSRRGHFLRFARELVARIAQADALFAIGEVGLTGELRVVNNLDQRLSEVRRLGFRRCVIPRRKGKPGARPEGLQVLEVANIGEAMRVIFGK